MTSAKISRLLCLQQHGSVTGFVSQARDSSPSNGDQSLHKKEPWRQGIGEGENGGGNDSFLCH